MWLFSTSEDQPDESQFDESLQAQNRKVPLVSDTKSNLRLLGLDTPGLHRDLQWWVPSDAARIIRVKKNDQNGVNKDEAMGDEYIHDVMEIPNCKIVGNGADNIDATNTSLRTQYTSWDLPKLSFETGDDEDSEEEVKVILLATESVICFKRPTICPGYVHSLHVGCSEDIENSHQRRR